MVGGMILLIVGSWYAWYAASHYDLGTFRRMGAGMFPTGLGIALAALGLIQVVAAFFRRGRTPSIRGWTPLFVTLGVIAFAVSVRPLGLMPAIVLVVTISSLAELKIRPRSLLLLCLVLCLLAWLIFRVTLNLPIALWHWPF